jgi:CheY-like chemotaxis protein
VVPNSLRFFLGVLVLAGWLMPALGQDSGQFYKKPETPAEFWRAMKHEIELGDFKLASAYLKGFIEKNPGDDELLQIQEKEGSSAFLRLLTIPGLRNEAKPLIERVDALVQKQLSDRSRLDKFIHNLNGEPEEREYAIAQLKRSGALAVPAMVDALLRTGKDGSLEHAAIASALPRLGKEAMPPLHAALDVNDANLKIQLMDVFRQSGDRDAVPYLWSLAASPKESDLVRTKARQVLAALLGTHADRLPQAKVALTDLAESYYRHQVKFVDPAAVTVWRWDGKQLAAQTVSASQAEEHYGLRFARQALDIDPAYHPAQIVFLSMVLDKGIGRPGARELLRSASPELVMTVLDRALVDRQVAVILAAAAALGDQAEVRAVRPTRGAGLPVLVRALDYPDRRVQMVAADAILRIPGQAAPPAGSRVIEILRGALAVDTSSKSKGKILIAFGNAGLAAQVGAAVRKAGYEDVIVHTGRGAMQRLTEAGDIDVVILDSAVPDPGLPALLAQLRADIAAGELPVLITTANGQESTVRPILDSYQAAREASPDQPAYYNEQGRRRVEDLNSVTKRFNEESARIEAGLRRSVQRYRNVAVIPVEDAVDGRSLAQVIERQTAETPSKPLSESERKEGAARAIEWLARLARGEAPGYNIQPAEGAILTTLRSPELAGLAVEATAGLRGRNVQRELAGVVFDPARPEELRSAAAVELCRQIQRNGLGLNEAQAKGIEKFYDGMPDSKLKANVALVVSSLHPNPQATGLRLEGYAPKPPAPPAKPAAPAPKPKEDKGDSDK